MRRRGRRTDLRRLGAVLLRVRDRHGAPALFQDKNLGYIEREITLTAKEPGEPQTASTAETSGT
jgi:hypothetical protein